MLMQKCSHIPFRNGLHLCCSFSCSTLIFYSLASLTQEHDMTNPQIALSQQIHFHYSCAHLGVKLVGKNVITDESTAGQLVGYLFGMKAFSQLVTV